MLSNALLATSKNIRRVATATGQTGGGASSITLTSVDIGPAISDRVIVVAAAGGAGASRQISGVTIGGSAATLAARSASAPVCSGIYYLAVPSGTSLNIVVSFTGSMGDIAVMPYILTGWGTVSVYDTATVSSNATTVLTTGFDTQAMGLSLCASVGAVSGGMQSFSGDLNSTDVSHTGSTAAISLLRMWATKAATGTAYGVSSSSASDKAITAVSFI